MAQPHHVLFLDHTARLSGGEIALRHLLGALDRSRVTPSLLLFEDGPLAEAARAMDIDTHVLPLDRAVAETRKDRIGALNQLTNAGRSLGFAQKLAKKIRALKPDLVHTNSLKSDVLGGIAGRLARTRVLWHVRDRIADDYLPRKVVRMFRFMARRVPAACIANSEASAETIRGAKVFVAHDGLPSSAFDRVAPRDTDPPVIGIVGRLSPWKGQHIFLRAAELVLERHPRTRFRIIGSAMFGEEAYERQLHELAGELEVSSSVEFAGFRDDVPGELQRLNVLVHASTTGEPFGQVVVEGMAASLPVIATRGGGVPEIIEHDRSGLLVPMNDAEALAAAINALLDDPAKAAELAIAGRERACSHFTIARTAATIHGIYDQLLTPR